MTLSAVAWVLSQIDPDMGAPTAVLEDDGAVGLDWDTRGYVLSVHVAEDGSGGWAGRVGNAGSVGRFLRSRGWPAELTEFQRQCLGKT